MLINIVFCVSTVVLCCKTYLNVIFTNFVQQLLFFIYNKFIETDLRLVDERCVSAFIGKLTTKIDKYFNYFLIVDHGNNYTPRSII